MAREVEKAKRLNDGAGGGTKATDNATSVSASAKGITRAQAEKSPMSTDARLRAAALEAGLPEGTVAEVKAKLRGEIPEDVMDRELPWILRDIAVGRKLMK